MQGRMHRYTPGLVEKAENPLYIIEMKRLCKDVDITDRGLISRAVYACLDKKYRRNDVIKYMSQTSGLKENQIRYIYFRYGNQRQDIPACPKKLPDSKKACHYPGGKEVYLLLWLFETHKQQKNYPKMESKIHDQEM